MFIPIGDFPNSPVRPYVNWALIAANVLVFVVAKLQTGGGAGYDAWTLDWGFTPVAPSIGTFFSSMFMHADLMHLGGNMLFLWIFGDNVEGRLGHAGYLLAYLAFGLAAVLFFLVLAPGSTIPLVGASGAIFGVEGFYFVAFAQNRVRVVYWMFILGAAEIPARVMLGMSFLFNLLYMMAEGSKIGGGVAYAAHVGGFAIGALLSIVLRVAAPNEEG